MEQSYTKYIWESTLAQEGPWVHHRWHSSLCIWGRRSQRYYKSYKLKCCQSFAVHKPLFCFNHALTLLDKLVYSDSSLFVFMTASLLNDLLMVNLATMKWINLTLSTSVPWPSPRKSHGFVAATGKLYVHGGRGERGTSCVWSKLS